MDTDALRIFAEASRGGPRLIGIDLGTKTIGLALSDLGRQIASPLETIKRVKFTPDVARLRFLCEQHAVGGLVIGLPLNMDGSEGVRVQSTHSFVRNLKPLLDLPAEVGQRESDRLGAEIDADQPGPAAGGLGEDA